MITALLTLSLMFSGCNSFEAFNQSLSGTDQSSLVSEGKIALDEGRFSDALDFFNRAFAKGSADDECYRGRASAFAGLSGFNMFKTLQVMQNGLIPPDSSAAIFMAARYIQNDSYLEKAIDDLWSISQTSLQDRLLRSLLVSLHVCRKLVEKYDTNFNGKLDANDQIDFDTRDDKTDNWSTLYNRATSVTDPLSLELAFLDMAMAFDGRGESWILVSPIQGQRFEGTFTAANRGSALALSNLADNLETAQVYFDNSESLFKQTLIALDGTE